MRRLRMIKKRGSMLSHKKKLLVTASTFPRWANDTEPRFVLDLAKSMSDRFDITVLAPAAAGAKEMEVLEDIKVIRYHYFPIHKWETLCYPGAIVPRIREKKIRLLLVPFLFLALFMKLYCILPEYDIVHAHWIIPQGIVQSFFKKPYIVTGHGGDVTSLNVGILKKLKIRCLRKARGITVVSEFLKEEILGLYPQADVEVISMGCNIKEFGKQHFAPDYFKQGNRKVVLYAGRLAEKKGVSYLIEAMRNVDALLVIVGGGPLEKRLKEQAEGLRNKIVFLGPKTHDELKVIYASADIFVAPSIVAKDGDQEGLPLVLLEAMASGLPIVSGESGGIRDIIINGQNGYIINVKNVNLLSERINAILSDEEKAKKFHLAGKLTVSDYDYSKIASKYYEIINRTTGLPDVDRIC